MNALEKITSIVILSAMPYVLNAQDVEKYNIDKNELMASIAYRPRNRDISENVNYSPALEEKIEEKKKTPLPISYSKLVEFPQYNHLKVLPKNFHPEKSHGHEYEFPISKHTGIAFEENIKLYDGRIHIEHVTAKIVFHLGYHKKN